MKHSSIFPNNSIDEEAERWRKRKILEMEMQNPPALLLYTKWNERKE